MVEEVAMEVAMVGAAAEVAIEEEDEVDSGLGGSTVCWSTWAWYFSVGVGGVCAIKVAAFQHLSRLCLLARGEEDDLLHSRAANGQEMRGRGI